MYPLYVIRPFRFQGARELAVALSVMRMRGVVTAVCALAALGSAVVLWRILPRMWPKIAMVTAAFLVLAFAALCRVNIYELMFHPNANPAFSPAAQSGLDKGEMVIAVRLGTAARAYPIRSMSYHHMINDVVGGVPIVATY